MCILAASDGTGELPKDLVEEVLSIEEDSGGSETGLDSGEYPHLALGPMRITFPSPTAILPAFVDKIAEPERTTTSRTHSYSDGEVV